MAIGEANEHTVWHGGNMESVCAGGFDQCYGDGDAVTERAIVTHSYEFFGRGSFGNKRIRSNRSDSKRERTGWGSNWNADNDKE